jgi:uncharacterized membrane protein
MIGGSALNEIKIFGIVLTVFLILDVPMVFFINNKMYADQFLKINGTSYSGMYVIIFAILSYLTLALGIYYFAVKQNSYLNAAILGFVIYGVYNFTNLAVLKQYEFKTGAIDIAWGTTLCLLVTAISLPIIKLLVHEDVLNAVVEKANDVIETTTDTTV